MRRLAIFFGLVFISLSACATIMPHFTNVYFFGDSLTDMGNYVAVNPVQPLVDVSAPVTNKTGGTNPGETWAAIWTRDEGLPKIDSDPSNPPSPKPPGGHNWAVSGSTTSEVLLKQVNTFIMTPAAYDQDPSQTLFVIWVGANDIFGPTKPLASSWWIKGKQRATLPALLAQLKTEMTSVINHGTKNIIASMDLLTTIIHAKYILVIGIPDLSETPLVASPNFDLATDAGFLYPLEHWVPGNSAVHNVSEAWNSRLKELLATFVANPAHAGVHVYYFDVSGAMNDMLAHYQQPPFSFKHDDTKSWFTLEEPQDSPDDYIFFNFIHPTSKLHTLLAQFIEQGKFLTVLSQTDCQHVRMSLNGMTIRQGQ